MNINTEELYKKALEKKMPERIGNDDPTITYQEYFLYYVLYFIFGKGNKIRELNSLCDAYKNGWIDESWGKMKASKFSKKEISLPWEKVF